MTQHSSIATTGNILLGFILIAAMMMSSIFYVFMYHHDFSIPITRRHQLSKNVMHQDRILFQSIPSYSFQQSSSASVEANFLPQRPRTMGHYFETAQGHHLWTETIDPNHVHFYHTDPQTEMTEDAVERQEWLLDSDSYDRGKADRFEQGDCVAQFDWQKSSFPTSNLVMEVDLTNLALDAQGHDSVRMIGNG